MIGPEDAVESEVAAVLEEVPVELDGSELEDWSADEESTWLVCPALLESPTPDDGVAAWLEDVPCDVCPVGSEELDAPMDAAGPIDVDPPLEELFVGATGCEQPKANIVMSTRRLLMLSP